MFTTKFPGTKMSASFLGRLYKKNIVRKKKVLIKKSTDSRQAGRIKRMIKFAKDQLTQYIKDGYKIYWIDETMFTRSTRKDYEYMVKTKNVEVEQKVFDTKSLAFVGAICLNEGLAFYKTFPKSVNRDKYQEFLHEILEANQEGGYVIYMDHLSVHTSKQIRHYLDMNGTEYLYSPVGSPEYNAIEFMFSKLKGIVKKRRLQDTS